MSKDLARLAEMVEQPKVFQEAQWETFTLGQPGGLGPTDWGLVAVVRLEPEALRDLVKDSSALPEGAVGLAREQVFDWYPESVRQSLVADAAGFHFDRPAYGIDRFARPPLQLGFFVPVSDEWLFLFLQTS